MTRVSEESLQAVVKTFGAIVPKKPTLPILSHILIDAEPDAIYLRATNLECGLRLRLNARGDDSWSLAVPLTALDRKQGYDIITLLPDLSTSTLTLKTERASQRAKGQPSADFPAWAAIDTPPLTCVAADDLKRAIDFVLEAVGKQQPVVFLTIQNNTLSLTALDGYRLHRATLDAQTAGDLTVALPADSLRKLIRVIGKATDDVEIGAAGGRVAFHFGSAELITLVADAKLNPRVEDIVTRRHIWTLRAEAGTLQKAIKRAQLFSDTCVLTIVRQSDSLNTVRITLSASSDDLGDVSTTLDTFQYVHLGAVTLPIMAEHFADAVGKVAKATADRLVALHFSTKIDPVVITSVSDNLRLSAVIMPPVVPDRRPALDYRINMAVEQRIADDKQAEGDYAAWVRATFGLEGYAAYSQRASRAAHLRHQGRWGKTYQPSPDAIIQEYEYLFRGGDRP